MLKLKALILKFQENIIVQQMIKIKQKNSENFTQPSTVHRRLLSPQQHRIISGNIIQQVQVFCTADGSTNQNIQKK